MQWSPWNFRLVLLSVLWIWSYCPCWNSWRIPPAIAADGCFRIWWCQAGEFSWSWNLRPEPNPGKMRNSLLRENGWSLLLPRLATGRCGLQSLSGSSRLWLDCCISRFVPFPQSACQIGQVSLTAGCRWTDTRPAFRGIGRWRMSASSAIPDVPGSRGSFRSSDAPDGYTLRWFAAWWLSAVSGYHFASEYTPWLIRHSGLEYRRSCTFRFS